MADIGALSASVGAQRRAFLEAVAEIRPRLHRYCSKMTGSLLDGEDVVQEALSHAFFRLHLLNDHTRMSSWLFRIAHNKAIDHIRRRKGHSVAWDEASEQLVAPVQVANSDVEEALTRVVTELPPKERACVILKDVLGYPLADIATIVDSTVAGVKAALYRGRGKLESARDKEAGHAAPRGPDEAEQRLINAYASRFNAHDWDGVTALLGADARLEVIDRVLLEGRDAIESAYFVNYAQLTWPWRLALAHVDGELMLVHFRKEGETWQPHAPIVMRWHNDQVVAMRDFVHVAYLLDHARVEPLDI